MAGLVPAIHADQPRRSGSYFMPSIRNSSIAARAGDLSDMDARDKPGHDGLI